MLLLAALLLASVTWGPHLGRDRIAARVGDLLGREVRVARIDVAPFAGRITVSDLRIAGAEPGDPMFALERAVLEVDPWQYLVRRVAVVRSVQLDAPALRVIRTAPRRFDVSDVLERLSGAPPAQRKTLWHVERIEITGGHLALEDRIVGRTARIETLRLSAAGLTNRDEGLVTPATLEADFTLNGRPVTLDARATPFADPPTGDARLRLDALPIAEVLPWITLPDDVRPTSGAIGLDLRAAHGPASAGERPTLRLDGTARLDALRIEDTRGLERVAARSITMTLAPSRLLEGMVHVSALEIGGARVAMGRRADGSLEWPAGQAGMPASGSSASVAASGAPAAPADPSDARITLRIDRLAIDTGELAWQDAALAAPLALRLSPVQVVGDALVVDDLRKPADVRGAARIEASVDDGSSLRAEVALDGRGGTASLTVAALDLPRWAPLAGPALRARVERGRVDARARLAWGGDGASWSVSEAGAELSELQVTHPGSAPARIAKLAVTDLAVDSGTRRIEAGSLAIDNARVAVRRASDGRIDLQDWYVPAAPVDGTGSRPAGSAETSPPWALLIRETRVGALDLDYQDAQIPREGRLPTVRLDARAANLSLDPQAPVPFEASAALPDGSRLAARGTLRPVPLDVDAQLQLERLPLTHLDPYTAPYVNLTLASGQLWGSGRLTLASSREGTLERIGFEGELSANEFRSIDKVSSDDFLRWTALAMPTVAIDWRTGKPADSRIEIGEVAFVDFYSRIILSAEGRLNLADILVDTASPDARRSLTASPAGTTGQPSPVDASAPAATAEALPATRAATPATRTAVRPGAASAPGPRPLVRIGTVRIASGNVNFTDLFIRPNYSAQLSQLVGVIEGIASDREAPSEVLITGRVDNDTPLEISGKINPLAPRSFIDLRAVARGFDLPKLSPYSSRWAGYPIEKGKLTADVRYTIEGEKLSAENRLTLNQLTFGNKVDGPDATSLPVRLAVSLLKDRDGNIALDLPISGTLDDPQFSVGGLLWRALGNLIVKVVSSPFTLLASLGGGAAAELSHIDFTAGETRLDDEHRRRLDALGRGLAERPGVSLEIAGYADPRADREAMQRERLENALRAAKLEGMRQADPRAELPPLRGVAIDPTERAALLAHVWRDAGLDASGDGKLPPPEALEEALLAHEPIAVEEVRQLAQQRAQAARDYLRDVRGISNERLYLLAPRIAADGEARPPSRADFAIR